MKVITNNKKYLFISYSKNQPLLTIKIKNSLHNNIKEANKKVLTHISSINKGFIINNDVINYIDTNIKVFPSFTFNKEKITQDIPLNTPHIGGRPAETNYLGRLMFYIYLYIGLPNTSSKSLFKFGRPCPIQICGGARWI